jgi:hypothetical protein
MDFQLQIYVTSFSLLQMRFLNNWTNWHISTTKPIQQLICLIYF